MLSMTILIAGCPSLDDVDTALWEVRKELKKGNQSGSAARYSFAVTSNEGTVEQ